MTEVHPTTYDIHDLMKILKYKQGAIRDLIKSGKLRKIHGIRKVRVSQQALDEFLNDKEVIDGKE